MSVASDAQGPFDWVFVSIAVDPGIDGGEAARCNPVKADLFSHHMKERASGTR